MNSYNLGAMSDTYTTGFGGYNTKPRKAKDDTNDTTGTNSPKLNNLGKQFKDENFNGWGVAGLTVVGSSTGGFVDTLMTIRKLGEHVSTLESGISHKDLTKFFDKTYNTKYSMIATGLGLAGGLVWEKMRSDGAKKHNTELLAKLRTEENGETV